MFLLRAVSSVSIAFWWTQIGSGLYSPLPSWWARIMRSVSSRLCICRNWQLLGRLVPIGWASRWRRNVVARDYFLSSAWTVSLFFENIIPKPSLSSWYFTVTNHRVSRRCRYEVDTSTESETTSTSSEDARSLRPRIRNTLMDDEFTSSSDGCESDHRLFDKSLREASGVKTSINIDESTFEHAIYFNRTYWCKTIWIFFLN